MRMMTQESSVDKCPTCGTTVIKFDPPLYFEAEETCGKEIEFYVTSLYDSKIILEHCVNYKGHEISFNPDERRHYALLEELVYFSEPY